MKKKIILITILFLTIGFAAVTTALVINGNSSIGTNQEDFDVYFSSAILDTEDVSDKVISEDKLNINYTTKDLSKIGDTSILEYEVTNASKNYDANVVVTCTGDGELVTITQTPQNQIVNATEIETGTVIVTLNQNVIEEQTIEFVCTLNVNAIERDELGSNYVKSSKTYALVGKYVDEDGVAIGNANLVVYDEVPHYVTSDIAGNVYLNDLNPGIYQIYYMNDSMESIKLMSKEEIISRAVSKASFTTTTEGDIILSDNSQITNDDVVKSSKYCEALIGRTFEYGYTGLEQNFTVPCEGEYKIELWGASGADLSSTGGKGSYTSGKIQLTKNTNMYLYIGSKGVNESVNISYGTLKFNGASGGNYTCYNYHSGRSGYNVYGGGATDIRIINGQWKNFESLKSRVMVAAGGSAANRNQNGSSGGGLIGYSGGQGTGATQTSAGGPNYGGFGYAGIPTYGASLCANSEANGASSGYYGGGTYNRSVINNGQLAAGSGSSFISGHNGCDAISESSTENSIIHTSQANHYSGYIFKDTVMIDGAGYNWTTEKGEYIGMPTYDGTATMTGNTGNGYAKITLLSID